VPTSIPLLEAGYDILLEKPFATNAEEMWRLADTARHCDRKVMICHVLRYAPFYAAIRQRLLDGGVVINRPPRDGRMAFLRSPDRISSELLQKGDALPAREPWASMPNSGEW
jgi:predicted dehydrogenase